MSRKVVIWLVWLALCFGLAGMLGYEMFVQEQKPNFVIGDATHGHHQIELSCDTCHTSPFGGEEVIHDACLGCHQEELKAAHDSHPIKKFTDPRNADRLEKINAVSCVTCHGEHKQDRTFAMGVTLPDDFCYECHADIAENRPSHEGMGFETCASAGCHNYHDNRALYEDFLLANSEGDKVKAVAMVLERTGTDALERKAALSIDDADAKSASPEHLQDWAASIHAEAGVNCTSCHEPQGQPWQDDPGLAACNSCHENEEKGFLLGKHGMKLAEGLGKMSPATGRQVFHDDADLTGLDCSSCHDAHNPAPQIAAVEACTSCHNDTHTQNYATSPHAELWKKEQSGELPEGSGVSCATCHMPREVHKEFGEEVVRVQHNQSMNLRPNEKMIRTACMSCHSLAFSLDALADPALIESNFNGLPAQNIPSIEMVLKRDVK